LTRKEDKLIVKEAYKIFLPIKQDWKQATKLYKLRRCLADFEDASSFLKVQKILKSISNTSDKENQWLKFGRSRN
jgi:hypothetical protein